MSDFRSDKMPSAEGRGRARAAWEAYSRAVNSVIDRTPLGDAISSVSASTVSDLAGFWLLWQLEGGFDGLRRLGMSRSSIFRKVSVFRKVFGVHPDEYVVPGVELNVEAYLASSKRGED